MHALCSIVNSSVCRRVPASERMAMAKKNQTTILDLMAVLCTTSSIPNIWMVSVVVSFSLSRTRCVCVISPAFVLILLFIYFSLFVSMWYETIGILLLFAASTARSLLPFFHLFILVHRSPFLLLLLFLVLYVQCCVTALQIYCYPLTYRHTFSSWKHTVCIKQKKHKKWNNQTQKNLA